MILISKSTIKYNNITNAKVNIYHTAFTAMLIDDV